MKRVIIRHVAEFEPFERDIPFGKSYVYHYHSPGKDTYVKTLDFISFTELFHRVQELFLENVENIGIRTELGRLPLNAGVLSPAIRSYVGINVIDLFPFIAKITFLVADSEEKILSGTARKATHSIIARVQYFPYRLDVSELFRFHEYGTALFLTLDDSAPTEDGIAPASVNIFSFLFFSPSDDILFLESVLTDCGQDLEELRITEKPPDNFVDSVKWKTEEIWPDGSYTTRWDMQYVRYVPLHIPSALRPLLEKQVKKANIELQNIPKEPCIKTIFHDDIFFI
ncbi:hypothetical protein JCM9492_10970 [Aquifex pyrophilus]